ncbi:MAG: membrane protein insertion efficiency factor YidD [Deltaproteobacteria bacterium]|nr:membrane protein insertion efficiency factor YidD [Deltaproteobacteria bacterium]MBN2674060.1 membrane protein insertion efficiency factor YidD [Deltaproteobacteria bacterium]
MSKLFILAIRFYQLAISPWLGPKCRFTPSCSHYTIQCIQRFGVLKGSFLGLKRLLRCHPFGGFGYDPPPEPHTHINVKEI